MRSSRFSNDSILPRLAIESENNGAAMFGNAGSCNGPAGPAPVFDGLERFYRCDLTKKQVTNSLRIMENCW